MFDWNNTAEALALNNENKLFRWKMQKKQNSHRNL